MVFVLFLMRAVLRNRWLAGTAFVALLALLSHLSNNQSITEELVSLIINITFTVAVVRLGLLTVAVASLVFGLVQGAPVTTNHMAWYFGNAVFMLSSVLAMAAWACYSSMAGRRLWRSDLFG